MTSYLCSWLLSDTSVTVEPTLQSTIPEISETLPLPSDDEGSETEKEDDDRPPAFPALFSAQRASSTGIQRILTDTDLMPPPPLPGLASRNPGVFASPSLAPPTTTLRLPQPSKKSRKVALAPGHSALDWANLGSSGQNLRGVDTLMRIPPSELKRHNKKDDAWSVFHGKVYNITPYLPYHPGGEKELMRVAGRDGTKLFINTHSWVNVEMMLDNCMVGFLVSETSS